jgi:hypothetical protein
MVIQQTIPSFYNASAATPLPNHGDFFNTHACLQHLSLSRATRQVFSCLLQLRVLGLGFFQDGDVGGRVLAMIVAIHLLVNVA